MEDKERVIGTVAAGAMSPFGGIPTLLQTVPTSRIIEMYRRKCGIDVGPCFLGHDSIDLFQCSRTGYRFWRPADVAGDEEFYHLISSSWPNYYRTERWEYSAARRAIAGSTRVLEIGCGRGFFLRSIEAIVPIALGLELNHEAAAHGVTKFPIENLTIERLGPIHNEEFDAVCSFQVLEHVARPDSFLRAAVNCLSPHGLLVVSTPNYNHEPYRHQLDAFDLPPHHVGHFDPTTFRNIADILHLDMVDVLLEPCCPPSAWVKGDTSLPGIYKLLKNVVGSVLNLTNSRNKPGPNILVIMRKP